MNNDQRVRPYLQELLPSRFVIIHSSFSSLYFKRAWIALDSSSYPGLFSRANIFFL
ncbi:unknown [Bacteroides sp. CAG:1076]|nr:unknown [Bacteroides sp. CAG:1076]